MAYLGEESEEDDFNEDGQFAANKSSTKATSGLWASLSSLVGQKQLSTSDIEPVIANMRDHLIGKNVASEVANKLCQSVAARLVGKVLGTFSSVHRTVKETLTESLLQLLTPKRRVDVIRDVLDAKANKRPYVITFCGVNGVGKSTNLAKICFWLVENRCRVLIAACDTFRYEKI
jgi:signal recognition particle receptor subunit alpha